MSKYASGGFVSVQEPKTFYGSLLYSGSSVNGVLSHNGHLARTLFYFQNFCSISMLVFFFITFTQDVFLYEEF